MRYRPLGPGGAVVSAISLELTPDPKRPRPGDWTNLFYAALENGISTFELCAADAVLLDGAAQALASVDRRLAFVGLRLGRPTPSRRCDFSPRGLMDEIGAALERTGLGYLDSVVLHEPAADELTPESVQALRQLKSAGTVRFIGVAGEDDSVDHHIASGAFDLVSTPFNLTSGWRERNRMRAAVACDMAVFGSRPFPKELHKQAQADAAKAAPSRRSPLAGSGTYAFLDRTRGWSAEDICIAYALTDPCLASVQIRPGAISHLEALAAVPDREMPPGLAAQIEMARFMPAPDGAAQRRA